MRMSSGPSHERKTAFPLVKLCIDDAKIEHNAVHAVPAGDLRRFFHMRKGCFREFQAAESSPLERSPCLYRGRIAVEAKQLAIRRIKNGASVTARANVPSMYRSPPRGESARMICPSNTGM